MHEILIALLIIVIVAIQIYVFTISLEKINIFKNILPSHENFKTVKVYIKESEIDTISIINIYKNLPEFSKKDRKKNKENEYIKIENKTESIKKYETVDDSDDYVFVEKDGVQSKIKTKNLDFFISKGWKIIDAN